MEELLNEFKKTWQIILENHREEIFSIRSNRISPGLIEEIEIEAYNSRSPLKHLATITLSQANTLLVQPWDKTIIPNIEKAIVEAKLGVMPSNDGQFIRLNFPPLTEEKRQELVKFLNQKTEEFKIRFRQARDEIKKRFQNLMDSGKIADEDAKYQFTEQLQKQVDEFNQKIEAAREKKEKEILSV
ncbi:MAG: ribosome recycling factor [Patescibacteria group bacterium]